MKKFETIKNNVKEKFTKFKKNTEVNLKKFKKNTEVNLKKFKKNTEVNLKKFKNFIKEKWSNKIFIIMLWGQLIFNMILTTLLICSMIMTSNLSKQLNDISNQNTSVTSSTKTQESVGSVSNMSSKVESMAADISASSTSSTSNPPTPSASTSSTVTAPPTNTSDLELLACVIYQEAGGDGSCDNCRRRVADVVLNRVADDRFPDTVKGVLTAKNQYGRYYYTGVVWPSRAKNASEKHAVDRAYRIAEEVLNGQHSDLYGNGYIWQAGFKQGTNNIRCCGTYFGK